MEDLEQYIDNLFENSRKKAAARPNPKSDVRFGLPDIEKFVVTFFENNSNSELKYHNLKHTFKVVCHTREISQHSGLNDDDSFIVESAAWFHDIGYLIRNEPEGHEVLGAELAEKYLKGNFVSAEIIAGVRACIMATILPQRPQDLLQEIICDADLYHLGTSELFFQDTLLHKEVEFRIGQPIDERRWTEGTLGLLNAHSYHTKYCQRLLGQQKRSNLNRLEMILRKLNP
nr:HD domain-containing protein [uncultured Dyadobacter sp.]